MLIPRVYSPGDGRITLCQGDCMEIMQTVTPGSISMIMTSPPYNLGVDYGSGIDDSSDRSAYLVWLWQWLGRALTCIRGDGHVFLNLNGSSKDPMMPHQFIAGLPTGCVLQNTFYWVKAVSDPVTEDPFGPVDSIGHFKPVNSLRFVNNVVEYVFHITKHGDSPLSKKAVGVPYVDQSNIKRWKNGGSGTRCRGNAVVIPYKTITSREKDRPHPAAFPEELPQYFMRLAGVGPEDTVMDPFMGSGSTGVAAIREGFGFLGMELSQEWYDHACARIGDELAKPVDNGRK